MNLNKVVDDMLEAQIKAITRTNIPKGLTDEEVIAIIKTHTTNDQITIAMDDIQDDIVDELIDEIHTANLVTWEHDSDGDRPNYDNLAEWLKMYYELRKK